MNLEKVNIQALAGIRLDHTNGILSSLLLEYIIVEKILPLDIHFVIAKIFAIFDDSYSEGLSLFDILKEPVELGKKI